MLFKRNTTHLLLLLLLPFFIGYAQKKTLRAEKISDKITVDGKLEESVWAQAEVATDFFMLEPDNGVPLSKEKRAEVKVLYDHEALYIGAKLYDDEPEKIQKEITERDKFGTADHFGIYINGFNDGQQDFRFFVSAAGTQLDCLATENTEDYSWDAIWASAVKIIDDGWIIEMKIPYAAVRFSDETNQTWGLNFYRELRRFRQKFTWSKVDRKIASVINQAGELKGIKNITPPTRLFFIPYASGYFEKNESTTKSTFKGGMDVKYGINDSFTLDAILVPDFGQAAFDDVILNLTPFEQQFNENRPFFTEGTDLFSRGNLLYSRRIGGPPSTRPKTAENEIIEGYPATVNLLNAVKVSGRTQNGLGVGFLNAVTERTYATIRDTVTGETRKIDVEPLANYNVTVFDQRFNQNSSVTFINTNVSRHGKFRDANVTGLLFDLNSKGNKYNVSGDMKMSSVYDVSNTNGLNTSVNLAKTFGKNRYSIGGNYISKNFNINDLGINFVTNFYSLNANYNYRIINPTKNYNSFRFSIDHNSEFQNETGKPQKFGFNFNVNSSTLQNDFFSYGIFIRPIKTYDFFESRIDGRFLEIPETYNVRFFISTNYNRKFALDVNPYYNYLNQKNRVNYGISVSPRYRFSDQFSLIYAFDFAEQKSDIGWVDFFEDDIILGKRNRTTVTNSLRGKFAINSIMTFNIVARQYWSSAENLEYVTLLEDGTFETNLAYADNKDANFNTWNFDLSYVWWFAPGSQITALYRNNAFDFRRDLDKNFSSNVSNLFENNLNHIFSVSIRYFIDYNHAKKWM